LRLTVHNSHSSNLNSLPSTSSLAYNPSGKILICPKYENLSFNMIEENREHHLATYLVDLCNVSAWEFDDCGGPTTRAIRLDKDADA
jgi:hypothetical protein